MSIDNIHRIETDSEDESFYNHLCQDINKRIIFSGEFGSGKTTFIKDFFEKNKNSFNTFFLNPVKYSVGKNEDIFEFIKIDLIIDLLKNHYIDEAKTENRESILSQSYLTNNYSKLISFFFNVVASLELETTIDGTSEKATKIQVAFKAVNAIKATIDGFKNLTKNNKSKNKILESEIDLALNTKGSIFEDNIVTQAIRAYLLTISIQSRSNVLIIDDFDRIDPEHIFRVLNIFSVHNDYLSGSYENKFGFDKIILICDIDSIESFFHFKYGEKANFNGFIDKFCSAKFYRFSSNFAINKFCQNLPKTIALSEDSSSFLSIILTYLVDNGYLTLRQIVKFNIAPQLIEDCILETIPIDKSKICDKSNMFESDNINLFLKDFILFYIISILSNILGDFQRLKNIVQQIIQNNPETLIPSTFHDAIFKILLVPAHIARSHKDKINILCSLDKKPVHCSSCNRPQTSNPKVLFAGHYVEINTIWSNVNKFNNNLPFFENVNVLPNRNLTNISTRNLFSELEIVLNYITRKRLFTKL